jgi:hypothetical protein
VLIGTVEGFYRDPVGRIRGALLAVDTGTPAVLPVIAEGAMQGLHLHRGDTIWLRGTLCSERIAGGRYGLVYIAPRLCEVLKTGGPRDA